MARPLRIEFPEALYCIIFHGNTKQNIFLEKSDFGDFLTVLYKVIKPNYFILHSYCLMQIIQDPKELPSLGSEGRQTGN